MKRRSFLQNSTVLIGAAMLPETVAAHDAKQKPIRFAHITDIHVNPGLIPEKGMALALQHIQSKAGKIDFIVNGGDAIMDALDKSKTDTATQFDLFKKILRDENKLPVYHTIGNHDVWGWFVKENKPDNDRLYGKVWAVETLEMQNRYYSFEQGNWHFIVLDSTQLNPQGGYIALLDQAQLEWLEQELKKVPADKFICIISHIPILSVCAGLFFNKTEPNGDLKTQRNLMHTDFFALKKLFAGFPNIRICISGHIHLQDEVEYLGIKYWCNGAVSGNWWKGTFQEFDPAYAIIELYPDGRSNRTMVKYN